MNTTPDRRAVILSAVPVSTAMRRYLHPGDRIMACDAGYHNAERLGVRPDWIVGDFDSAARPEHQDNLVVLPHVKDDTDTHYAARWLCEQGFRQIVLLGAIGGARIEHTIANLHTAVYLAEQGVDVLLADEQSELRILSPDRPMELSRGDWKYLSLFPLDGPLTGVCLQGVFYPLQDATLRPDYPLGVSNEFTEPTARLSCTGGHGLVIVTRDDG